MSSKKISLDDVFNDDEFGLLDSKIKNGNSKTDVERLIESFEEINSFYETHGREPSSSSISEYGLLARLKTFRTEEDKKKVVKAFDRHNLLGSLSTNKSSIDEVFEDDEFGLLETDSDLSIFKFKHVPSPDERAEADFVAQRRPMDEEQFRLYEKMFQKVHAEIKTGERKIRPFYSLEKNLQVGQFYILDGIMLFLESADLEEKLRGNKTGNRVQMDGRTQTIFENGTVSNMLFRSLGKQIQKEGKLITSPDKASQDELFSNSSLVKEEDVRTGWIYVLKSKSSHPEIASLNDLYKIGYSSTPLDERIKNAKYEATYLFSDVTKVASYACFNRKADKLEKLLHRFFASACLDIDLYSPDGHRFSPREWFVVPFDIVEEAIRLILSEEVVRYKYDAINRTIIEVDEEFF